jgi:hypothetical protein
MSVELINNTEVVVPAVVDIANIISQIFTLSTSDKWKIAESVLANIKGDKPSKKSKKTKDPNAPKRELSPDSYMYLVNKSVWPIIKSLAEVETDADQKKWYGDVKTRTFVSQSIWEPIKGLASEERIEKISKVSKDQVITLLNKHRESPVEAKPSKAAEAKPKVPRKTTKKVDAEKVADIETVVEEVIVEETKVEETKVKKERKKSEKKPKEVAAKEKEPESEPVVAAKDDIEVVPYAWEHDFGKGATTYERVDFEGMAYIYDIKSKEYLGAYMEKTNKLNKKVADPTA